MGWAVPEWYMWSGCARAESGRSPQVRSCSRDSHLELPCSVSWTRHDVFCWAGGRHPPNTMTRPGHHQLLMPDREVNEQRLLMLQAAVASASHKGSTWHVAAADKVWVPTACLPEADCRQHLAMASGHQAAPCAGTFWILGLWCLLACHDVVPATALAYGS